ncbi:hypothetical protein KM043_009192 [Ampulex compressa]|nr:hypothetical protein KM043_009192 [Ampulex compressa]
MVSEQTKVSRFLFPSSARGRFYNGNLPHNLGGVERRALRRERENSSYEVGYSQVRSHLVEQKRVLPSYSGRSSSHEDISMDLDDEGERPGARNGPSIESPAEKGQVRDPRSKYWDTGSPFEGSLHEDEERRTGRRSDKDER